MAEFFLDSFYCFFFTVLASVYFVLGIGKNEDVRKLLLDGGDAAGVLTFDYVYDFFGKGKGLFLYDLTAFNHVNGDVVVDKAKNLKVKHFDVAFYFQNVFFAHFIASNVFNDGYGVVNLVEAELIVYVKAFAGADVVEHEAFFDLSYV